MSHILAESEPSDSASAPISGTARGQQTCSVAGDATVSANKVRYATKELFYGFHATQIAAVLCVTEQTAYHFKSGIRRPGRTALRLWELYQSGRILGDEWNGWQARDGVLFDPEGHRTTQPMLRAYAFVWQLARELARDNPIATDALDGYAFLATARLERERKKRSTRASGATARPPLDRTDVDPLTLRPRASTA